MTTKEAPQAALPQPTPKQETSKAEAVVAATVKEEKGPVEFSQTDLEQVCSLHHQLVSPPGPSSDITCLC